MGSTQSTWGNVSVNVKMKTAFALLAVACFAAFASANPVERTSCSITELLNCQNEINQAMTDCSHLNSIEEIQTCINDILAATDCQKCICDALPGVCGKH